MLNSLQFDLWFSQGLTIILRFIWGVAICLFFPTSLVHSQGVGVGTESPTETLDVNGKIRLREGAENGNILMSDSLGVGIWTPINDILSYQTMCVTDFGAVGNDEQDDSDAFQTAIDSASQKGGKLCIPTGVYHISKTLILPNGVILEGEGMGSTPLETPYNGSVLRFDGSGWVISIQGHNVGIRDIVIHDAGHHSEGAVRVFAEGRTVESVSMHRVLATGFVSGVGLGLYARFGGGIAYATFHDVRIRHAKVGIHIQEFDSSFVNANTFHHGAVSGGGFDRCLWVQGGNNNVFYNTVFEPFQSKFGHIVVDNGQISASGIRVEGETHPIDRPLIELKKGTTGSVLKGIYSGGLTLDRGDNLINMISTRSMTASNPGYNELVNPGFQGVEQDSIPFWTFVGSGYRLEILPSELVDRHHVLKITIASGSGLYLRPNWDVSPTVRQLNRHANINFGGYLKTDKPNITYCTYNSELGNITSVPHPGDNEWHFIGLRGPTKTTQGMRPRWYINNSSSTDSSVVYISCPTFSFGMGLPTIESMPLTISGGRLHGTLSTAMMTVDMPSDHWLSVPHYGNTFEINGIHDLHRINHAPADRFPRGTTITLLFNDAGMRVLKSGYLLLISDMVVSENSSLTLISLGDGTWREISRNQ